MLANSRLGSKSGRDTPRLSGEKPTVLQLPIRSTTRRTCITRFGLSRGLRPSACVSGCNVADFALTPAEQRLFRALDARGVRFLVIELSAAVIEGAPIATQDIDLWLEHIDQRVAQAAADANGFWISGFGMQPSAFGGEDLDRIDVVLTAHGLDDFVTEYGKALVREVDGIPLRVLPLDRVIASKQATRRPKDLAVLPALEATMAARNEDHDG